MRKGAKRRREGSTTSELVKTLFGFRGKDAEKKKSRGGGKKGGGFVWEEGRGGGETGPKWGEGKKKKQKKRKRLLHHRKVLLKTTDCKGRAAKQAEGCRYRSVLTEKTGSSGRCEERHDSPGQTGTGGVAEKDPWERRLLGGTAVP